MGNKLTSMNRKVSFIFARTWCVLQSREQSIHISLAISILSYSTVCWQFQFLSLNRTFTAGSTVTVFATRILLKIKTLQLRFSCKQIKPMVHSTKEREREQDLENMVDTVKHPSLAPSNFSGSPVDQFWAFIKKFLFQIVQLLTINI